MSTEQTTNFNELAETAARFRKQIFLQLSGGTLKLKPNMIYGFIYDTGEIKPLNRFKIGDGNKAFLFKTDSKIGHKFVDIERIIDLSLLKYGYAFRKVKEPIKFAKYLESLNN